MGGDPLREGPGGLQEARDRDALRRGERQVRRVRGLLCRTSRKPRVLARRSFWVLVPRPKALALTNTGTGEHSLTFFLSARVALWCIRVGQRQRFVAVAS